MTYVDRLPVAFVGDTVATLPIYKTDPILETGTLMLIEPAVNVVGVPVNGAAITNIARPALLARGLGAAIGDPTWSMPPAANDGVKMKIERSAKGGLHAIVGQTNLPADGTGASVLWPLGLIQYLIDNPTHQYVLSQWLRVTRPYVGATNYPTATVASAFNAGISTSPFLGVAAANGVDNYLKTITGAIVGTNSYALMSADNRRHAAHFGKTNFLAATTGMPSYIVYRVTLEDLTVTGRTSGAFGTVDGTEFAAAFAAGGRYAADTYTAPSTIA